MIGEHGDLTQPLLPKHIDRSDGHNIHGQSQQLTESLPPKSVNIIRNLGTKEFSNQLKEWLQSDDPGHQKLLKRFFLGPFFHKYEGHPYKMYGRLDGKNSYLIVYLTDLKRIAGEGGFKQGFPSGIQMHGHGVIYNIDTGKPDHEGNFVNGKMHGHGISYHKSGHIQIQGKWEKRVLKEGTSYYDIEEIQRQGENEEIESEGKNLRVAFKGEWDEKGQLKKGTQYNRKGEKIFEGKLHHNSI